MAYGATPRPEIWTYGQNIGPAVAAPRPGPAGSFTPAGIPRPGALRPMAPQQAAGMGTRNLAQYGRGMAGFGNMHGIGGNMGGALGSGASLGFGANGVQPVFRGVPR